MAHRAPLVRRAGDTLRVTLPKRQRELKVVGIVTVEGRSSVARGDLVLAPPETVREAAGLPPGAWHGVLVKAAPGTDAARLGEDLARDLAGSDLTVRTASAVRDAHSAELRSTGAVVGGAIGMVSSVAVFVGVFVVANTFGTLVRQRTRRLALLGAIGATPRQIKRLIRLEALALGAVASAGGVLVGYPVSAVLTGLFARDGFDVSAAAVPGVSRATALTATEAKLVSPPPRRSGDDSGAPLYLAVTGADQDALPSVLDLGGNLRPLRPGEIALTSTIMEGQRLAKGRRITLRGGGGQVTLTVAGAYHDPSHVFADQALVSAETMERLDPGAATVAVLVRGGDKEDLARAVADVPGVEVLDRAAYVKTAADAMTSGMLVIYGFIGMALVLALFGMATTVSMSVAERTREFGLLGAVGATVAQIRSIVRWEAATVVLLGGLLGTGTAVGTVFLMHVATGSSFLRPDPPWWLFVVIAAGAAVVTLATSALPARRAASVPVLEAARAE